MQHGTVACLALQTMKTLAKKVALVTGGSRGIGAAIVKKLTAEGASVAFTYQKSEELARRVANEVAAEGGEAIAIHADNSDALSVINTVHETARRFGRLDILVNNAGIGMYKHITEFAIEDFDNIVQVNVKAVFAASQAAIQYLKGGGTIITIGSCQAERMPGPGGSLYAMSKSALIGLTKGMARDLGPDKITANLIQPGPIDTDMNPANGPHASGQIELMALDHFGSPHDIAALVCFLSRGEARYITGAAIAIDGGTNI